MEIVEQQRQRPSPGRLFNRRTATIEQAETRLPGAAAQLGQRRREEIPLHHAGWILPLSPRAGKLRDWGGLGKAWKACLEAAGITRPFTPHGLRRTFNDKLRRAKVDPVIAKAITGHVTEEMREHQSTVGLDEKRAAASALLLLPRGESADAGAADSPWGAAESSALRKGTLRGSRTSPR